MLKSTVLLVGIGAAVILTGCGGQNNKLNKVKDNVNAKIESGKEMVQEGKNLADNNKGLVSGLKDAMKRGVTMKCVADSPDGHWVTYTNGKNTKTEGTTMDGHEMVIVAKDDVIYTWDKKTKKGQKMDKKCMEDFQKSMGMNIPEEEDNFEDFTPDKMEAQEAEGKLKCSPSTKADFSVPGDVEFTDQCALLKSQMSGLKNQMDQMKNIKK